MYNLSVKQFVSQMKLFIVWASSGSELFAKDMNPFSSWQIVGIYSHAWIEPDVFLAKPIYHVAVAIWHICTISVQIIALTKFSYKLILVIILINPYLDNGKIIKHNKSISCMNSIYCISRQNPFSHIYIFNDHVQSKGSNYYCYKP